MYGFLARLGPEDVEAIAAQAMVEMLERGFTALAEFHYLHHAPDGARYANPAEMAERVAAAAAQTGIGLTLLPVLYTHGGFGPLPPSEGQRRFLNGTDEYLRLLDASRRAIAPLEDARLGVAPHSLRAVDGRADRRGAGCRPAMARSTSTSPSRWRRWRRASRGAGSGRSSGSWPPSPWAAAGARCTPPT